MLEGVYAALLTPFDAHGELMEGLLRDHVEWLVRKGVDGLYICGNSGQGLYQSVIERRHLAEVVKDQVNGRCRIIAHVAALTTRDAAALACHAESIGLDAVASLPPIYWSYRDDEVVRYYEDIMEHCGLPGLMYVFSGAGMAPVSVETVLRIAKIPGMVGMKYTHHDFFRMQDIRQRLDHQWLVLSGPDELFLPALTMGVQGSIGTTQNIFPELFIEIRRCFREGDMPRAMALQESVTRIVRLYQPYNSCVTAHTMLAARGFKVSCCRAPFAAAVPQAHADAIIEELRAIMAACPLSFDP